MASKQIPKKGLSRDAVENRWKELAANDMDYKKGKYFGYVYYPGDESDTIIKDAYAKFSSANALNPAVFPSLLQMENEIVNMAIQLLHGDDLVSGSLTSGGTESIFLAVKTARDWSKDNRNIQFPEILVPQTAHPAFSKSAEIMGIKCIGVSVNESFKIDLEDLKSKITVNTILIVGSAPSYPQGVIDPIEEMAKIAKAKNLLFHVDACVGGFILPFLKMEQIDLPDFDFTIDGVTSMSADLHKYGYAAKGASVILYRNAELRKSQFFLKTDWSGGIYGSPSFMGTRGGGPIAAAWTALNVIGEEGYRTMAKNTWDETQKIKSAIESEIKELYILGDPKATLFAMASKEIDVYEVADELAELGWIINRQQLPTSLHVLLNNIHVGKGDLFINDLKIAVKKAKRFSIGHLKNNVQLGAIKQLKRVLNEDQFKSLTNYFSSKENPEQKRKAAMYGMMSELSGSGTLNDMVLKHLDKIYRIEEQGK